MFVHSFDTCIPIIPFPKKCLEEKISNSWLLVLNLIFVCMYFNIYFNLILILEFQNMFDDYGDEYVGEPTEDSRIADVTSTSIRRLATSTTSPPTTTTVTPGWVTRLSSALNELVSPAEDQTEAQGQRPGSYTQHDEAEQRLRIWQDVSISNFSPVLLI